MGCIAQGLCMSMCCVSGSTVLRATLCCTGQFVIAMFVFVNKLSFTLSCLASIFFYIGAPQSRIPLTLLMTQIRGCAHCERVSGMNDRAQLTAWTN